MAQNEGYNALIILSIIGGNFFAKFSFRALCCPGGESSLVSTLASLNWPVTRAPFPDPHPPTLLRRAQTTPPPARANQFSTCHASRSNSSYCYKAEHNMRIHENSEANCCPHTTLTPKSGFRFPGVGGVMGAPPKLGGGGSWKRAPMTEIIISIGARRKFLSTMVYIRKVTHAYPPHVARKI